MRKIMHKDFFLDDVIQRGPPGFCKVKTSPPLSVYVSGTWHVPRSSCYTFEKPVPFSSSHPANNVCTSTRQYTFFHNEPNQPIGMYAFSDQQQTHRRAHTIKYFPRCFSWFITVNRHIYDLENICRIAAGHQEQDSQSYRTNAPPKTSKIPITGDISNLFFKNAWRISWNRDFWWFRWLLLVSLHLCQLVTRESVILTQEPGTMYSKFAYPIFE